jgi:hypothetical protein
MTKGLCLAALTGGVFTALAVPAHGERSALAMLDQLDSGVWELRQYGQSGAMRSICLDSGRKLIQLEHPGAVCSSVVITDKANEVTVQYTCKGKGYGRTSVRRETNSLVQIDSQGIVDGRPFAFAAEGRRVGSCRP